MLPSHMRCLLALSLGCLIGISAAIGGEGRPKVLLSPRFDPAAERIELFAGIDSGLISAVMKPRDAAGGAIFIENLTDRPLTVELPETVVGVQVLPQFGNLFPGGPTGSSTQTRGTNSGQGANQPVGGSLQNGTSGSGSNPNFRVNVPFNVNQPPGQGFFSIPPERVARIEYHSVCLEHGAVDPKLGNVYKLIRPEAFSSDPRLPFLLQELAREGRTTPALQAAAWHIVNGMTWEELQAKQFHRAAAPDDPYFSLSDLNGARDVVRRVEMATGGARISGTDSPATPTTGGGDESPKREALSGSKSSRSSGDT